MPPTSPSIITASQPYVITYNTTLQGGGFYHDSLITDTFSITATVENHQESTSGSRSIRIGNPPDTCPSGWPILPEGQETFLSITQGPWGGYSHIQHRLEAIDMSATTGHSLYATHTGTATYLDPASDNYGPKMVLISSNCNGTDFQSLYAHLSVSFVNTGDRVTQGQIIGLSGADYPGNDHLHYEFLGLKMVPPYIPKDVPYGCSGDCNVTIP